MREFLNESGSRTINQIEDRYKKVLIDRFGYDKLKQVEFGELIEFDGYRFDLDNIRWVIGDVDSVLEYFYYEIGRSLRNVNDILNIVPFSVIKEYFNKKRVQIDDLIEIIIENEIEDKSFFDLIAYLPAESRQEYEKELVRFELLSDSEKKEKYKEIEELIYSDVKDVLISKYKDIYEERPNYFYNNYIKNSKRVMNELKSMIDAKDFYEWLWDDDILDIYKLISDEYVELYDNEGIILYNMPHGKSPLAKFEEDFLSFVNPEKKGMFQ